MKWNGLSAGAKGDAEVLQMDLPENRLLKGKGEVKKKCKCGCVTLCSCEMYPPHH